MKVLLVDDDREILNILSDFLRYKEHDTFRAENGKQALDMCLKEEVFDLILSDIKMPIMDGLSLLENLRKKKIETPVVLISGHGDFDISLKALKLGALDFIVKPFHLRSVEEVLAKMEIVLSRKSESFGTISFIENQQLTIVADSKTENIGKIVAYFNSQLEDLCTYVSFDRAKLITCLQEALVNAVVHGNLEVESKLKEVNWNNYQDLIVEREGIDCYLKKTVTLCYRMSRKEIVFEISDEGSGFKRDALSDPTDPMNWLKISGRGLLIIHSYMDSIEWNAKGNEIRMTKLIS